ncbi:MAG TPA: phenylalanine--tRNA ligase subunit beta, partial [Roseiflexaceae bacterium]
MRVPLSWLKEYVDVNIPVEELAYRLTLAGLEVAEVEYIGVAGAELPWDPEKLVIGNILEVRQHPNADRLVLADVDYGAGEPHTVVTGAPNLFQYKGLGRLTQPLKGVYAKEGVQLYDGHAAGQVKMILKGRPVRGVMSDAMLCSEKEIGLSDEHEGILLLPDDAPVGMPLRDYLGDVVLDIDLTPNLARALSILGVAREVAAHTGAALHIPEFPVEATGPRIEERARVTVETPDLCPRFTVTLIEGIKIGPSPLWMQRRLLMAGMRPINNIVDISNYVMLELGEPSHAFDADKVADQHLVVRLARPGEQLTTLDGREHELTPDRLLVCDPTGPLGIAGVMGGVSSEVSDQTTRVLLEAAIWEPTTIRRAAQTLKLPSEASRRFERGVDYELPPLMQRRALSLIRQLNPQAVVARGMIDVYSRPWKRVVLHLPPYEVKRIVGVDLS